VFSAVLCDGQIGYVRHSVECQNSATLCFDIQVRVVRVWQSHSTADDILSQRG